MSAGKILSLVAFLVLVVGCGTLIGVTITPGDWYAALEKPFFNPPNWIFGPVWTFLYVLIAVAGWRTWQRRPGGTSMAVWWTQLGLNLSWSPVFFGLHMIGLALAIILLLLAAVVSFMVVTRRVDRVSCLLFAPYAAWVAFASLLNASIFALN